MWLKRTQSNIRVHNRNFSCSSFKDIQALCADDFNSDAAAATATTAADPQSSPRTRRSIFHRVRLANSVLRALSSSPSLESLTEANGFAGKPPLVDAPSKKLPDELQPEPLISFPGAEKRVVVYFTSLRVVRSTFEDCNAVRSILRGLRVLVDERDVSMDSRFTGELQKILGKHEKSKLTLPRVFIGGRYIGGAEEIRRLNEIGELKKYVEGLAAAPPGTCEVCGGYRFILCDNCSGSHKYYSEKGGFKSCTTCNENGLIRCPSCSCAPF
ncbi:OLC1v1006300C1 [Oldenlandia corymbosa var. corymbosa]|uniref:OLC1v1006300C1 n=1 Tax=Oldenlandia corymbosa var. corymbosa TaxID=529605 RepID=A0AAV1DH65_OLDCO|nr:OLC1v1006300C1 [Oldenlandia corymbosa var. corymbosa]